MTDIVRHLCVNLTSVKKTTVPKNKTKQKTLLEHETHTMEERPKTAPETALSQYWGSTEQR